MIDPDQAITTVQDFNWWLIPKAGLLFLLFLFILFGILVLRQIQLMNRVVSGTSNRPLKTLAWFALGFGILVFMIALFVL